MPRDPTILGQEMSGAYGTPCRRSKNEGILFFKDRVGVIAPPSINHRADDGYQGSVSHAFDSSSRTIAFRDEAPVSSLLSKIGATLSLL